MKKNSVTTETNKEITKKKVFKLGKNLTIMLLTFAIMTIFVPVASADADAESAFNKITGEFVTWFKRIGALVAFVGGIMFALAIKNNDAEQKQQGLLTLAAGFACVAIAGLASTFGLNPTEGGGAAAKAAMILPFIH